MQMQPQLSSWSEEDLKHHAALVNLLDRNASWNCNTTEVLQLNRSLVWFMQLKQKIEDSQAEIIKVHKPAEKSNEEG